MNLRPVCRFPKVSERLCSGHQTLNGLVEGKTTRIQVGIGTATRIRVRKRRSSIGHSSLRTGFHLGRGNAGIRCGVRTGFFGTLPHGFRFIPEPFSCLGAP
jgi:hypothetical protein